ncbi:CONSTANS-like zinc finger protein [Striga asiatica]|uniref:CONSTANS-like zinc finger protein n=1 Tax=Striga asiatica TaxID=4170 RepID=A0A5A7QRG2_STRAF|nr:CONSTANS-like zinc finger protein [Striga asiatica]
MNTKRRPTARKLKARRPKFLSLRLQFPADEAKQIEVPAKADATSDRLTLFPLQPENQAEERENNDHENVAFFFSAADGGASTLTGLLDTSTAAESISSHTNNNSSRLDYLPPPSPASLTQAYGEERAALERNALRNRDRDSSEEKWVCYSEVVKEEEVTSSAVDPRRPAGIRRMSLKLDYEEIMNAWSNKGPLYIDAADNSQIVPDIAHHFLSQEPSNYSGLNSGCNGGSWIVPEIVGDIDNGEMMKMKCNDDHELKMGQREASVLRYKEKRQNRLFSKKIRYQVRKLNAEKRPRLKGRFVKRS